MWKPIDKARFIQIVMTEYGANLHLASDLWYLRPVDHQHDTEDEIRGNLELMGRDWIQRNNPRAETIDRHDYINDKAAADKCAVCRGLKRSAPHNLEPLQVKGAIVAFGEQTRYRGRRSETGQ